jgi:hypothetical protein
LRRDDAPAHLQPSTTPLSTKEIDAEGRLTTRAPWITLPEPQRQPANGLSKIMLRCLGKAGPLIRRRHTPTLFLSS